MSYRPSEKQQVHVALPHSRFPYHDATSLKNRQRPHRRHHRSTRLASLCLSDHDMFAATKFVSLSFTYRSNTVSIYLLGGRGREAGFSSRWVPIDTACLYAALVTLDSGIWYTANRGWRLAQQINRRDTVWIHTISMRKRHSSPTKQHPVWGL